MVVLALLTNILCDLKESLAPLLLQFYYLSGTAWMVSYSAEGSYKKEMR